MSTNESEPDIQMGAPSLDVIRGVSALIQSGELAVGMRNGAASAIAKACLAELEGAFKQVASFPQVFPLAEPQGSPAADDANFSQPHQASRRSADRNRSKRQRQAREEIFVALRHRMVTRLHVISDSLQAMVILLGSPQLPVAAPISVARTSLESGLLLDHEVGPGANGERLQRTVAAELWEIEQAYKASQILFRGRGPGVQSTPWEVSMTPAALVAKYREIRQLAGAAGFTVDDAKKRKFAGGPAPSSVGFGQVVTSIDVSTTRLAESVANPGVEVPEGQIELLWSLCSGATHGAMWLAGSELQRSVTTREFGGSEIVTATQACLLGAMLAVRSCESYFAMDSDLSASLNNRFRRLLRNVAPMLG